MIKIIAVGKLHQKGIIDQTQYYLKQMPIHVEIVEVQDEPNATGMQQEGLRILNKIKDNDFVIALAISGKTMNSEAFAKWIDERMTYSAADLVFIIGGSYGLSKEVMDRANFELSFSNMTFPHQLIRLMLIEQIYRSQMILKHHPYHK